MDIATFIKLRNDEFEFLDSLDLKPYLKEGLDVYDIMNKIEENHSKDYYEGVIFNCIDRDDFISYLKRRYGNKIYFCSHITYSFHLNK